MSARRPGIKARLERWLLWRGTNKEFCAAEGVSLTAFGASLRRYSREENEFARALAANLEDRDGGWSKQGMNPEDYVPCAVCGLRGHVAWDKARCYQPISLWRGQDPHCTAVGGASGADGRVARTR